MLKYAVPSKINFKQIAARLVRFCLNTRRQIGYPCLHFVKVDIFNRLRPVGKDNHFFASHLYIAALQCIRMSNGTRIRQHAHYPIGKCRHQLGVSGQKAHFTFFTRNNHHVAFLGKKLFRRSDYVTGERRHLVLFLLQFLVGGVYVLDSALVAEALLGNFIALTVENFFE